jgi:hypothetical protein
MKPKQSTPQSGSPSEPAVTPEGPQGTGSRDVVNRPAYRYPVNPFIGQQRETKRLYALEEKRNRAIRAAAEELQKVLELGDFWREALPEALLSVLESYDRRAAYLAAKAYITNHCELESELFPGIQSLTNPQKPDAGTQGGQ